MITHMALQHMALLKVTYGLTLNSRGVQFNNIIALAQKTEPLTAAEVAVLEHFVHSNNSVLNNTVYFDNEIISPVSHSYETYKLKKTRHIKPKTRLQQLKTHRPDFKPDYTEKPKTITVYIDEPVKIPTNRERKRRGRPPKQP
jgi:hypothetical protein